jgi:hypothetical protein
MKTICFWCGKTHRGRAPASLRCRRLSRRASTLVRAGVPAWVLLGIVDRSGTQALDSQENFERAAREFAQALPGRQSLGPLVALTAAKRKRKPAAPPKEEK